MRTGMEAAQQALARWWRRLAASEAYHAWNGIGVDKKGNPAATVRTFGSGKKRKEVVIGYNRNHDTESRINWPPPETVLEANPELQEEMYRVPEQPQDFDAKETERNVGPAPFSPGVDRAMMKPSKSALMRLKKKQLQQALESLNLDNVGLKEELAMRLLGAVDLYSALKDSSQHITKQEAANILVRARCTDVCIIDVRNTCDFTSHMIIGTARSTQQVYAAAGAIVHHLKSKGIIGGEDGEGPRMEGKNGSDWILVDVGDVIVHVFLKEARAKYDLEGLWIKRDGMNAQFVQQPVTADTATTENLGRGKNNLP